MLRGLAGDHPQANPQKPNVAGERVFKEGAIGPRQRQELVFR